MFNQLIFKTRELFFSQTCFQLLIGMLGAGILLLLAHLIEPTPKPKIATVNITGIVNQFIQQQIQQHLPQDQVKANVKEFSDELQSTLNAVSQNRHVVILPQEAVIAGGIDLTAAVESQVKQLQRNSANNSRD